VLNSRHVDLFGFSDTLASALAQQLVRELHKGRSGGERFLAMLPMTQLPVAHIADECGFSSQSHCTACFRAAHASTPGQYRAHLQGAARV
jgi:AraC-like DNA-binding protein